MEIAGTQIAAAVSSGTTVANEVQNKTEAIEQKAVETLVESVPDPDSSVGQNVDVSV